MNEIELEQQIQTYDVEDASLTRVNRGIEVSDLSAFAAVTREHERSISSTFLFRLPQAWRRTRGRGVRVALLDTGVDTKHPDLVDSIVKTADFTGQGIEDLNGHGTHCAGIVGANSTGPGLIGVAPECELLIGKVLGNDGSGSFSNIAEGVDWAVDSDAHIICLSMCGPSSSPLLYRSITYALAKGVHIVCAAGSADESPTKLGYPARYGGAITVGSHADDGVSSSHGRELDLTAPGSNIWSTYKRGSYRQLSGCSMASSFVTGIAALIVSGQLSVSYSDNPIFNCEDMRACLMALASLPGHQDNAHLPPFLFTGHAAERESTVC